MGADVLESLLTNPISVFLIALAATVLNFEFLKTVPNKMKKNASKWTIVFGVLNGLFVTLVYKFIKMVAPMWVMLVFPLILVCELMLMSEDSKRSYFRIWLKCIFNFSCVYWGVANILGILMVEYLNKENVFLLTLLIVSVWTYYLCFGKSFSMSGYKMIIHEKAAGKMFFRYFVICSIFLVFFTFNGKIFTVGQTMDEAARRMLCCEMFLKIAFIWWSSRLLFVMITNQMSYVKNEVYTENVLDKERAFRNTVMRKGIFSLNIDVTGDEIKEGAEFLNPTIWKNDVPASKVIEGLLQDCIHPEDEEEFLHTNDRDVIRERVDLIPYYSHQIRVSPKGIVKYFCLGEQSSRRYQETDKEWIWFKIDYIYTRNPITGDVYTYVAVFDVDLQVEQGENLKKSASTDFLTGILNRAAMEKNINERFEKKNKEGTFFIIDVDNFKSVNDVLGHPVGDQLLKQIAGTLTEVFRKNDLVGRLGGDEFCVFMKDVTDPEAIKTKAEMVNDKCRIECYDESGQCVKVSVSIGAASINPQIAGYSELYKCADLALYETKRKGKDTYTIYSEGM